MLTTHVQQRDRQTRPSRGYLRFRSAMRSAVGFSHLDIKKQGILDGEGRL